MGVLKEKELWAGKGIIVGAPMGYFQARFCSLFNSCLRT
jgi:hypothetical protein